MEKELIRLLLDNTFYTNNKYRITNTMFPDNMQNLYNLIIATQEKYNKDLTLGEIKALYKVSYPNITRAQWEILEEIIDNVPSEISQEVAEEIIQKSFITEMGRQIAQIGIDVVNGQTSNFDEIQKILQKITQGNVFDQEDLQPLSNELEDILEAITITTQWSFNIPDLYKVAQGFGPGTFSVVFARTEVGKTAFWVSLCAAPGGFASQEAIIHCYCNEEPAMRTQGRAVMSYTGMALPELTLRIEEAKAQYATIKENMKFFECKGRSIEDMGRHIDRHRPNIVVFDQLDKLSISGTFARQDERLGALYQYARELGTTNDCAVIAISQASAPSEGKVYLSSVDLAEARTSKAAEADLLMGIGKSSVHTENTRVINIIKNKITGNHEDVVCQLRPEISRYIA